MPACGIKGYPFKIPFTLPAPTQSPPPPEVIVKTWDHVPRPRFLVNTGGGVRCARSCTALLSHRQGCAAFGSPEPPLAETALLGDRPCALPPSPAA